MAKLQTVVDEYFAMWNADDPNERLEHIKQAWTEDARYVDPLSDATGYEGISAMVEGVRAHYPGSTLRLASELDAHHEFVRFGWDVLDAGGELFLTGVDVCRIAPDGRFAGLAGFFGAAVPAVATQS